MTEVSPYMAWASAHFARDVWTRERAKNTWTTPVALVVAMLILAIAEQLIWDAGWVKPNLRQRLSGEQPIVCWAVDGNQLTCVLDAPGYGHD